MGTLSDTGNGKLRCLINGRFIGASVTGVQRVAAEIVRTLGVAQLNRENWVADVDFAIAVPARLDKQAAMFGLPVVTIVPFNGNAWEQLALPALAQADVILNLCNMGPLASNRCVTMIHDAQIFLSPQSYSRAFRNWYAVAHRVIGRRHLATLTVSEYSARELASVGICDQALPVYNGSDHILRIPANDVIIQQLGLAGKRYVVAPSSIFTHKNIGLLFRVFLDRRLADIPLVLYGSAGRADFAAAGMTPPAGIKFAGRIDDGAMRALLEHAACLAFPSRTEGFGLPPLEAMQLGCPVLTSGCGAIGEVCGDAVCYAGADDDLAWADALVRLCSNDEDRNRLAAMGKRRAQEFTWEASAKRVASIVRQVGMKAGKRD